MNHVADEDREEDVEDNEEEDGGHITTPNSLSL
jgi:hypothetical protein